MLSSEGEPEPILRSFGLSVYLPSFFVGLGEGAVIPFIALAARDLGASVPVAGLIFALHRLAMLVFNIPAASLVARVGERRAMSLATLILIAALAGCAWSPSLLLFAASLFVLGSGMAVWKLARFTYVVDVVPVRLRGRAIAALGGIQRLARLIGPLLAAGAIALVGIGGAFYVHIAAAFVAWWALRMVRDPPDRSLKLGHANVTSFVGLAGERAVTLRRVGVVVMIFGVVNASRDVIIPLWANYIGLDAATVGLIFSASSALEMMLFYPAGSVMDRWGRKFMAIPSLTVLSAAFFAIPFADRFVWLMVVGLMAGIGNGLGTGLVMTLGSDFAPVLGRERFLGIWRLIADGGQAGGPLLVAGVGAIASIGAAANLIGLLGLMGVFLMAFGVREPLERHRRHNAEADDND